MRAARVMEPNEVPYGLIGSIGAVRVNDESGMDA